MISQKRLIHLFNLFGYQTDIDTPFYIRITNEGVGCMLLPKSPLGMFWWVLYIHLLVERKVLKLPPLITLRMLQMHVAIMKEEKKNNH